MPELIEFYNGVKVWGASVPDEERRSIAESIYTHLEAIQEHKAKAKLCSKGICSLDWKPSKL